MCNLTDDRPEDGMRIASLSIGHRFAASTIIHFLSIISQPTDVLPIHSGPYSTGSRLLKLVRKEEKEMCEVALTELPVSEWSSLVVFMS